MNRELLALGVAGVLAGCGGLPNDAPSPTYPPYVPPPNPPPPVPTAPPARVVTAPPANPDLPLVPTNVTADPSKHSCRGPNSCKGDGGCKMDRNYCRGQNACKGQGGCKTA